MQDLVTDRPTDHIRLISLCPLHIYRVAGYSNIEFPMMKGSNRAYYLCLREIY